MKKTSLIIRNMFTKYRPLLANRLVHAMTWYIIGNGLEKAVYVGGVIIFTRLLLPEEYGTISLFTTWTSVFMILFTFNLFPALRRIYHDIDELAYKNYISSALLFGLITISVIVSILVIFPGTWFTMLFSLEKPYIILAGIAILLEYPMRVMRTIWWENYGYRSNVLYSILLASISLLLSIIFILLIPELFGSQIPKEYGRVAGIIVTNLLLILLLIPNKHYFGNLWINWRYIKSMLILSVPLIPHALSSIILGQFDRIVIDANFGRFVTGLYSYGYQIGLIVLMVTISTNRVWSPWFMEKMKQKQYALLSLRNNQYLHMMIAFMVVSVLISPQLVRLMAPVQYHEAVQITPIIVASSYFIFLYTLLSTYLLYEKKTASISFGTATAGVLNIVLNLLFVPVYGYVMAAWTTLASYVVLFIIYWFLSRRHFPQGYVIFRLIPMILYGVVICCIAFVVSTFYGNV